jgi:hypothetical protein
MADPMATISSRLARLAALGPLALLIAGCGSHVVVVSGSVLRLRLDEYRITPQEVQVHPGRLKIIAYNTGILTHNVRVELARRGAGSQGLVLGGTPNARPGQEVIAKVDLAPGRYLLVDTIANHFDLGMFGTLIVK